MSYIRRFEFVEMVNNMLEFLTPKHLAEDLNSSVTKINKWADGSELPISDRTKLYKMMQRHSVWDDF